MKPNSWVSSAQAAELLTKQIATWPLAATNYKALESVETKSFDMGGFTIRVQYNPSRILSSAAKIDKESLQKRPCFLCPDHLPVEQERLPFGSGYIVLSNPYPIFPQHFTIPSREHAPQCIRSRFADFLELARRLDAFTVFYNGPLCGASAPDHAHFQAASRSFMPMDDEINVRITDKCRVLGGKEGGLFLLTGYLRNGFVIKASTLSAALSLFDAVHDALDLKPDEVEPRMNLFAYYTDDRWTVVVIPRRQHRPWQYAAEGEQHLLTSPGAADIGGVFITPLKEDFDKMNAGLLRDVFSQVCFSDGEIEEIAGRIASMYK